MSCYSINKGIWIRCQIVELCREVKNLNQLAKALNMTKDRVAKHCGRLFDEGWLSVKKENGWTNTYSTIREDKYPPPPEDFSFTPKAKEETIPGARVFRMEYFDRIPGYFKSELRPAEFRGIPSSASLL